jgi:hypothetical protein
MAFKITQKPTFISRVTVETPNQKGGFDKSTFNAEFKRCGMDEIEELKKVPQKEVLQQVLVGWTDLLDDDNKPVDFNDSNVNALLNISPALIALGESFWSALFKAREKN